MERSPSAVSVSAGLFATVGEVAERMRRTSGADILSLYLYDADTRTYYAPVASGLPDDDLAGSISDMRDQLARYLADAAQGKAPDDLQPTQYGPIVWLTVTRRTLYAKDAPKEIDSSFVRRHRVQSVLGLPLVAGETLVGLLLLNFCEKAGTKKGPLDAPGVAALEREAARAAEAIARAREAEERAAFAAAGQLAAQLATPAANGDAFRRQLTDALAGLLATTGLDAAAVYQRLPEAGRCALVAALGYPDAPPELDLPPAPAAPGNIPPNAALAQVGGAEGLQPVAALPLRGGDHLHGWLLVLGRDPLALHRRVPATGLLLQTAADLIAGALGSQELIATLEDTNRVLGALSRMSGVLLQPGASRQQVLDAVAHHLTDPAVPEFAFQFANVYLLDDPAGHVNGALDVLMSAGAAAAAAIDAVPAGEGGGNGSTATGTGRRVPRWALGPSRALAADDVLAYVARHWQVVAVGPTADGEGADFVAGYPPDQVQRIEVPVVRADGGVVAHAPAALIGPAGSAAANGQEPAAAVFTLDGDIFEASRHQDLVRVFVPFGLDAHRRASGVLEAGYHHAGRRQLDRTQIEALRAGAAQVAVAAETARLYEDVKRHAEQLEITSDVSKAIAASIELDQTLRLVAKNLVRLVDASLCQIALLDEDGSAWHGAAASDGEELWRRQRGELTDASFVREVLDHRAPLVIEDALNSELVNPYYARLFGIRALLALPLLADDQPIGVVILAQRERTRSFTADEVQRTNGLAHQAAIAIKNARLYAFTEEERHIQKDVLLLGFGQWGQKAYQHLLTLKQFFNFKTHVVVPDRPEKRDKLAALAAEVRAQGDEFYLDAAEAPAYDQLQRALESSCYVITYIATPAATHLPVLAQFYGLSNVAVIEKPLGASPEAYRAFLDGVDGSVELVAADHYYFKLEVRLLQLLMTEERTLKAFIDSVEEIELELLEEQPLTGAAADIGIIADMMPHAFAIVSLFTPLDRLQFASELAPLQIARQEPLQGEKETYARLVASFPHQGRAVRLVIDVGKGVKNAKWIKLSGERHHGSRRSFYKFDFINGEAIDGTQTNLRAAVRRIREPGVPDNAHLTMLRHCIEKRRPAVGILAIREAMRSNQRIQELQALASDLLARDDWTTYRQGQRPAFPEARPLHWPDAAANGDAAEGAGDRAD